MECHLIAMIKVSVTNAPGSEAWVLSIDMARRGDRGHYECQVPIFELTIPKWVLLRETLFVGSVRSSNSHPDLLVIQHPTHFFRFSMSAII